MSVLSREQIKELGLVENASPDALQPNGVDLTVTHIEQFINVGGICCEGKVLPPTEECYRHPHGWILMPGAYLVTFNETVNLPNDVMAYLHPRSTLLRCGVSLETAVWDAGYRGKGQSLLVVHNPAGFHVEYQARIAQMTFHKLAEAAEEGYDGSYQGEGITEDASAHAL